MKTKSKKEALRSIFVALLEFMRNREISEITITSLCKKAGVSRAYYYKHFTTYDDIIEQAQISEIVDYVRALPHQESYKMSELMAAYFQFIIDNRRSYLLLIESGKETVLIKTFETAYRYLYVHHFLQIKVGSRVQSPYWSAFIAGAVVNTAVQWLQADAKQSPKKLGKLVTLYLATE